MADLKAKFFILNATLGPHIRGQITSVLQNQNKVNYKKKPIQDGFNKDSRRGQSKNKKNYFDTQLL